MLKNLTNKYLIILGSKSPRRKELLEKIIPDFVIRTQDTDENYPDNLIGNEIAIYLSKIKSKAIKTNENELIITADTIVVLGDEVLGKPDSKEDAITTLKLLSEKKHQVITGITIRTKEKEISFSDTTEVEFYPLSNKEIEHYVENDKPYDKAGAYGIQEWIGYIGIKEIKGDYYNVMGLPIRRLYRELKEFT